MKPVWIIDDDRSIRWVLEKALAREGIEFKSFASADEAMHALTHDAPQIVISDIRMPGSSGLELLQILRGQYPHLPVIIMTAIVSPITRPIPSITAARIPLDAAGSMTRHIVCQCVAPSASAPSL